MTTNPLNQYRQNIFSQNGEDGVILAIFDVIGTTNKWFCEFGAWDGVLFSNTRRLCDRDWYGVMIESHGERFKELDENTAEFNVLPIHALVAAEGPNSLDNLLATTPIPKDFDLLSIDIDGDDYWVWKGLKNYKPRVVVIEVNSDYSETKDMIPGQEGTSIKSMVELGRELGYELAIHTGNAIFVKKEYAEALGVTGPWQDRFDRSWVKHGN